jgi:hypothetical protein
MLSPGAVNYGSGTFDEIRFSGRALDQNAVRFDGTEGSAIMDANPGNLNGESTSVFRLEASLENVQEFRVESGWQVGGILNARAGLPIEVLITRPDIVYRDSRNGTYVSSPIVAADGAIVTTPVVNVPGGGASRNVRRPDVVPGVDPYVRSGGLVYVNPAAFTIPMPGTFGNLGRDALKGPVLAQLALTLDKKFRLTERVNLQFRAEAYNIINDTNFQAPGAGQPSLTNALGTGANQLQPAQPFTVGAAGGTFGKLTSTVFESHRPSAPTGNFSFHYG